MNNWNEIRKHYAFYQEKIMQCEKCRLVEIGDLLPEFMARLKARSERALQMKNSGKYRHIPS